MAEKPKAVIIDLDGTLCNADHRIHHVKKRPKDWDAFFAEAHLDRPNEWCMDLAQALYGFGYHIIYLTGRSQSEMSWDWITRNSAPTFNCKLLTRRPDDHRPDNEYKREVYLRDIEPHYRVMLALDDRGRIISMFRDLGVVALQCSDWEEKDAAEGGNAPEEIRQHFEKVNGGSK